MLDVDLVTMVLVIEFVGTLVVWILMLMRKMHRLEGFKNRKNSSEEFSENENVVFRHSPHESTIEVLTLKSFWAMRGRTKQKTSKEKTNKAWL